MLEYVGDPGGVWRVCLETDREHIILVIPSHMEIFRPGLLMV